MLFPVTGNQPIANNEPFSHALQPNTEIIIPAGNHILWREKQLFSFTHPDPPVLVCNSIQFILMYKL
jgi:hypothetical protein